MRRALVLMLTVLAVAVCPVANAQQPSREAMDEHRVERMETLLAELVERLDVLGARIRQLEDNQDRLIETVNELAGPASPPPSLPSGRDDDTRDAPAPVPAPELEAIAPPDVDGAKLEADYRTALLLQAEGKFDQAVPLFESVYESDPDGDLADNALFWLGEIRFGMKEYQSAIKMFERLTADYPDGNRAPDALLRVALSYSALGDLLMARGVLERVIERYPYSTAAANARSQLERIRY